MKRFFRRIVAGVAMMAMAIGVVPSVMPKAQKAEIETDTKDLYISDGGITLNEEDPSRISAALYVNEPLETVEIQWLAGADKSNLSVIKDWSLSDNTFEWTPDVPGRYYIEAQVRYIDGDYVIQRSRSVVEYHPAIKGICQMPNPSEGGGYLIGIESFDNTNNRYQYEMLILDCTKYAAGEDAWIYSTGRCQTDGNCLWTIWQPLYGYYWTLFRVYDSLTGTILDERCFGFANIDDPSAGIVDSSQTEDYEWVNEPFEVVNPHDPANSPYYCLTNDAEIDARVQEILSQIIVPGMSDIEQLYAIYVWIMDNSYYQVDPGYWRKPYVSTYDTRIAAQSYSILFKGYGSCVNYASAFVVMARALGYDAYTMYGAFVNGGGARVEHGWVNIQLDGVMYTCDPQIDDQSWNGTSTSFFMITDEQCNGRYVYSDRQGDYAAFNFFTLK